MTLAMIDTDQPVNEQVSMSKADFDRSVLIEKKLREFTRGCGHDDPWRLLSRLRDIVIAEFSYDGEDPKGVKVQDYQEAVDAAEVLIEQARLRCP